MEIIEAKILSEALESILIVLKIDTGKIVDILVPKGIRNPIGSIRIRDALGNNSEL